ncbi:MAG: OsmC family protein, partial [Bdellovibrionota bacterium]
MITGKRGSGLSAALSDGRHSFLAGLETKLGGIDEAPGPHELLEAALTACTILTVQLYADRKQWKLEGTDVKVQIVQEGAGGNKLRREVTFRGELDADQRARLREIAEKCPIHLFL